MNTKTDTSSEASRAARDSFFLAATIEGKSPHTIALYEYVLKAFEKFLGTTALLGASSNDIRRYLLELTDKGYKRATIATHCKELKAFYNFMVAEDYLEKSPVASIKAPKSPRIYPYVLSEEDVDRLLKATTGTSYIDKRNYAIMVFFLDTGVRVSELCRLTLEDVNLATYNARVNGKTGERTVHFGKVAAKALSRYLRVRGFVAHEDHFFTSQKGDSLGRHAILRMTTRLGKKAGITGKRVSPHTLRHTAATFWIKNGGDATTLQRQLGQSDPRMVDVYVNLVGKDLAEAHSRYSPLKRIMGR